MLKRVGIYVVLALVFALLVSARPANAQLGNSGSMEGIVKDPSGGVVAGATVEISYPVSGFQRSATADADGAVKFTNVPFNPYHLTVTASGFAPFTQDVDVRSAVPVTLQISLKISASSTSVMVEASGGDLIETEASAHTDVDTGLIERLPLESQSSSVSSLLTVATPGVVALNLAAPGTNDPDRNPSRVAPRNLFDASIGEDDLFHNDRYKWSLRLTAINLTNKTALYNFLSTFSGTHFVSPRAYTAELGFHC